MKGSAKWIHVLSSGRLSLLGDVFQCLHSESEMLLPSCIHLTAFMVSFPAPNIDIQGVLCFIFFFLHHSYCEVYLHISSWQSLSFEFWIWFTLDILNLWTLICQWQYLIVFLLKGYVLTCLNPFCKEENGCSEVSDTSCLFSFLFYCWWLSLSFWEKITPYKAWKSCADSKLTYSCLM